MPKINPRIKSIDDLLGLDAAEESPIEPTQLNVTGTITVDVPLSFGFGHLPPMQITMKLNAKYVPRF